MHLKAFIPTLSILFAAVSCMPTPSNLWQPNSAAPEAVLMYNFNYASNLVKRLDPIMSKYSQRPVILQSPWEYVRDQKTMRAARKDLIEPEELSALLQEYYYAGKISGLHYQEYMRQYTYLKPRLQLYSDFLEAGLDVLKWISVMTFEKELRRVEKQGEEDWWERQLDQEGNQIEAERKRRDAGWTGIDIEDLMIRKFILQCRREVAFGV